jgi:hypothetical protein
MGDHALCTLRLLAGTLVTILAVLATPAVQGDMSECSNKKTLDERNRCMAKYSGSATFCDRITNYGPRTECYTMVVRKQRDNRNGKTNNTDTATD